MKTTLVIAVRNGERYLYETLLQLEGVQCHVLISDNYSTDETPNIISKFPQFRSLKPPMPLSMLEHWNWASSKVETPYMRLVGHDDLVNPDNVIQHETFLDHHPECSSVRSFRKIFFGSLFSPKTVLCPKYAGSEVKNALTLLEAVLRFGTNAGGEPFTTTVRVSSFRQIGGEWGGDKFGMCELNTWMKLAKVGQTGWVDASAGLFRVHTNSYSSSLGNPLKQAQLVRSWIFEQEEFPSLGKFAKLKSFYTTTFRALARTFFYIILKTFS